jgi:hypothetical protein
VSAASEELEYPWPPPLLNWDWWPLARLLTVCFLLGAAGHGYFGWHVDLPSLVPRLGKPKDFIRRLKRAGFSLDHETQSQERDAYSEEIHESGLKARS